MAIRKTLSPRAGLLPALVVLLAHAATAASATGKDRPRTTPPPESIASPAAAEAAEAESGEIVVTASLIAEPRGRAPLAVAVLDRDALGRRTDRSVADALREIPGITVNAYGGPGSFSSVGIRGSSSAQVLYLLDGVPMNGAAGGDMDLSLLPLAAFGRVEVLKGPGSAFFGANALGGTVQLVPAGARDGPGSLLASFGDGRTERQEVFVTAELPAGLDFAYAFGALSSRGFRQNGDFDRAASLFRLRFADSAGVEASVTGLTSEADLGVPGSAAFLTPHARQRQKRDQLGAQVRVQALPRLSLRAAPFWFEHTVNYGDRSASWAAPHRFDFTRSESRGRSLGATFLADWEQSFHPPSGAPPVRSQVTAGMFLRSDRLNHWSESGGDAYGYDAAACGNAAPPCVVRTAAYDGFGVRTAGGTAGMLQGVAHVGRGFSLLGALRYDRYAGIAASPTPLSPPPPGRPAPPRPEFSALSPMIALRASTDAGRTVRLSAGRAFRAPSLNDLYWKDAYSEGNPWLRPETAVHYEISGEQVLSRGAVELRTEAALFRSDVEDLIAWGPADPADPSSVWRPANVEAPAGRRAGAEIRGAEFAVAARRGGILSVSGALTYLDAQERATASPLRDRPRLRLRGGVALEPRRGASLAIWVDAVDRRFTGSTYLPPYTVWNVRTAAGPFFVTIENVFDRAYEEQAGYPLPGRAVTAGLRLDL